VSRASSKLDEMLTVVEAIIFANAGGPPGKGYAGLSQVCVPYAGALTRLGSCVRTVSFAILLPYLRPVLTRMIFTLRPKEWALSIWI